MKGSTFKRCTCPPQYRTTVDQATGREKKIRINCRRNHGSWSYIIDTGRDAEGRRRQLKKGGFKSEDEAVAAMQLEIQRVNTGTFTSDDGQTVAQWLATWVDLKARAGRRESTLRSYRQHIEAHIAPAIGRIRLRDLRPGHVDKLLSQLNDGTRSAATVQRIHATLRSALSTAVRQRLITFNAAKDIELPRVKRPKVKPWEPAELGAFLDSVAAHRLGALFELIAATGLRRGEAIGLRWDDVDLTRRTLIVRQQLVQVVGRKKAKAAPVPCPYCAPGHLGVAFGEPKTDAGEGRVVDLDEHTVGVLLAHQLRQQAEREAWGDAYADHGLLFAREDGNPMRPDDVTKLFGVLVDAAGLRRVRLHDLRHGQASLMLAAGVDMTVVSKRLGHSSISITVDTYSHLLGGVGRDAADRAAALIPRAAREPDATNPRPTGAPAASAEPNGRAAQQVSAGVESGPPGARTLNLRIKSPQLCQLS